MPDTIPPTGDHVACVGIAKSYGHQVILEDFDLTIAYQEKVALIGPSGSGKSTILRIIANLEQPDAGQILINNVEAGVHRPVGMVFQHFNLFPHLTAIGNCTLALKHVKKQPSKIAAQNARELLELVGLCSVIDRYPHQLSGGEQQRVALARALTLEPEILLLDEITSSLDPELIIGIHKVIQDIARARPLTIVLVTHHLEFARRFSDRVCFLHSGKILEQGSPDRLLDAPIKERTKEFVKALSLAI